MCPAKRNSEVSKMMKKGKTSPPNRVTLKTMKRKRSWYNSRRNLHAPLRQNAEEKR
jgi:hypothetical protein